MTGINYALGEGLGLVANWTIGLDGLGFHRGCVRLSSGAMSVCSFFFSFLLFAVLLRFGYEMNTGQPKRVRKYSVLCYFLEEFIKTLC